MSKPTFIMMCGLPNSGKTGLARMFSGEIVRKSDVDHDQIIALLQAGKNAIYDAQNLSKAERITTLKLLRDHADFGEAICVYVQKNVADIHHKFAAQNKYIPIKALLQDQIDEIQIPSYDEGWDRIITTIAPQTQKPILY